MEASTTSIQAYCSPWCMRCTHQPPMSWVRPLAMVRASSRMVSAGTPQMAAAHSASFT